MYATTVELRIEQLESGRRLERRLHPRDNLGELAGFNHLLHDVEAADELSADDELREGGPVVELFETCGVNVMSYRGYGTQ
jgi:hypothetical protein